MKTKKKAKTKVDCERYMMSAKNDEDFDEEEDENKKCTSRKEAPRSHHHKSENPNEVHNTTMNACLFHDDQKNKTKCSPQCVTPSNPKEKVARHEGGERHTHKHRSHRHTHRKRHSSESSVRHEAASNTHVFLSDEREQIKGVADEHVPWHNPNELHSVERNLKQGPGTSGTRRNVSYARHQDTTLGAEALSHPEPGRHSRVFVEETRPGAVAMPGIDSDGLTIEEGYDEQVTVASHEESTVHVIAQAVDTEEENRLRHEHDQAIHEQNRMRHELDQLHQILDNAPIVTPVITTNGDVENGGENVHTNRDDLATGSDDHKCGFKGRRWFAMSAILLIVVAVAVTLALVLPQEPTPPAQTTLVPNTQEPTTISPTAEPTTPQDPTTSATTAEPTTLMPNTQEPTTVAPTAEPTPSAETLSELLSSASSDGGAALADPSTPQNKAFEWIAGDPNLAGYFDQEKIQRYALATLYYTTKGDSWVMRDNWLSYESVCGKWYSNDYDNMVVDCTNDGISSLALGINNLQGSLPPEIGMLSNSLVHLSLWDNSLIGTIPNELGLLTKLTELELSGNGFTGTVPTGSLASLTLLENLYLYANDLTGSLDALCGIGFFNFEADCYEEIICTCCTSCV